MSDDRRPVPEADLSRTLVERLRAAAERKWAVRLDVACELWAEAADELERLATFEEKDAYETAERPW